MKKRFVTGLTASMAAVASLVFLESPLMGILVILLSAMASYEICHVAQLKNKLFISTAVVVAALTPPILEYRLFERLNVPVFLPLLGYFFLLVIFMLARFETTKFMDIFVVLLGSMAVPAAISCVTSIRWIVLTQDPVRENNLAVYFVFFALCAPWFTDIFALYTGVNLGKHKLCPKISPKKTVEGAVGGLVLAAATNVGFAVLFNLFWLEQHKIRLWAVLGLSLLLSAFSMMGDLAASVFKRNFGAKDYGRLFPGHGGVMDRFDSMVFVVPVVFGILQLQYHYGWALLTEVIAT